jgi:protein-tyrosine phosphatase
VARGLWFASAGTGSLDGYPASEGSVLVGAEVGVDLRSHRSRTLTDEMVARAVQLLCLSRSHLDAVVDAAPEAAAKTVMLRPDGRDIADPFGMEPDAYRRARDEIAAAVAARVDEWLRLLPAR